ncbi:uroporphyrinogen-III C-methyltransferase [Marinomonas transparens]|uniref:Uroporphyrinogen-III C-methyltransferase n=1 Tax=Marinomonas transparens TaxID=2795388 RepID=A0A934JU06_9GAMM|nr:uroporphyrinogen-III C-methyltransferase [Marinomonas transparens]MBJ7538296.1 uroporphyrinogen-III C-methyltransferase [Marinomonas transparens]
MTENNKQEHQSEEAAQENASTETTTKQALPVQPKGKTTSTLAVSPSIVSPVASVSLVLSIAALAASGWLYYQTTQSSFPSDIQQLSIQQANLSNQLQTQKLSQSALSQLAGQIKTAEHTIQLQNAQLLTHQEQQAKQSDKLLSLESKLNRLNNTTKEDWKLAEAEYLIRLANQRLLLESDSSGAEALLTSADNILNELEDPIFFATRKALAKDIQALKSTSQFDVVGYYLQLSALYDNVAILPQREPSKEWQKTTEQEESPDSAITTTEKVTTTLVNLWQSIRSLVVINYNHKPIKALLPPAEYQELVTGLQLQLDVAEVALVKGETIIYQKALSRVATAVTEHFDTQAQSVISFLGSLTALQQIDPSPELPLPRESLVAMKALMKDWNNRAEKNHTSELEATAVDTVPITIPEKTRVEETVLPEAENVTIPDAITGDKA